nr:vegetative cell wall protein gp1-like [Lolium perenne]
MSLRLIYLSPIISPSISSDLVQIRGFSVRPWSKSTNSARAVLAGPASPAPLLRHSPCPPALAGASSAALPLAPTSSTAAGHPPPLRPARLAKPRSEPPNLHAAAAPHSPGHHARSSTPSPSPRCRVSPPSAGQHPGRAFHSSLRRAQPPSLAPSLTARRATGSAAHALASRPPTTTTSSKAAAAANRPTRASLPPWPARTCSTPSALGQLELKHHQASPLPPHASASAARSASPARSPRTRQAASVCASSPSHALQSTQQW